MEDSKVNKILCVTEIGPFQLIPDGCFREGVSMENGSMLGSRGQGPWIQHLQFSGFTEEMMSFRGDQ